MQTQQYPIQVNSSIRNIMQQYPNREQKCRPSSSSDKNAAEQSRPVVMLQASCEWIYVYPQGIYDLMVYVKRKYKNPSIYITENGLGEADDTKQRFTEARVDEMRKNYHIDHLRYLSEAIEDGVKVKGYFVWSLFDNYEWAAGYTNRFGLVYIEYRDGNLTRYPKGSAIWYMNFLKDKDTKAPKKLVAPAK